MWKSLAAEGGKRERERKKVVYFEALTSGNSLIIACGQLNEQTMLLLPQMPTRMRCGTVGSLSFQPQKGRPPTSTSQKERRKRKKNPRNLTQKRPYLILRLGPYSSQHLHQERAASASVSLSCYRTKCKDWVSNVQSKTAKSLEGSFCGNTWEPLWAAVSVFDVMQRKNHGKHWFNLY